MTYALGLQLAADAVRSATMTEPTAYDGSLEVHPPVLLCEGGQTWVGATAVAYGRDRPNALVEDVVGQFTVDRIFLTAGRMLTPDDAMRELLWGIVSEVGAARGELPGAVSIVCPATWDPPTRDRVERIVAALGLTSALLVVADDCYLAASDAFGRLPHQQAAAPPATVELPALESTFKRPPRDKEPAMVVTPKPTRVKSSRPAIIGGIVAIAAIIAVLVFVLVHNASSKSTSPPTSSRSSPVVRASADVGSTPSPILPPEPVLLPSRGER